MRQHAAWSDVIDLVMATRARAVAIGLGAGPLGSLRVCLRS
jgi:hypothetical protein